MTKAFFSHSGLKNRKRLKSVNRQSTFRYFKAGVMIGMMMMMMMMMVMMTMTVIVIRVPGCPRCGEWSNL